MDVDAQTAALLGAASTLMDEWGAMGTVAALGGGLRAALESVALPRGSAHMRGQAEGLLVAVAASLGVAHDSCAASAFADALQATPAPSLRLRGRSCVRMQVQTPSYASGSPAASAATVDTAALVDLVALCSMMGVDMFISLTAPPTAVAPLGPAAYAAAHTRQMARLAASASGGAGVAPGPTAAAAGILAGTQTALPSFGLTREWRDADDSDDSAFALGWGSSMAFPLPPQPDSDGTRGPRPQQQQFDAVLQALLLPALPPLGLTMECLAEGVTLPAPLQVYVQASVRGGKRVAKGGVQG